mmetsp:Transcript_57435/g.99762  ORF Transcript_57435/g.99762 Transcript_57435/m.99762 type:complete len:192 (-) Transcript_57435:143-718(-)
MDRHTLQKRSEDGICKLALNNSTQQKLKGLREQQAGLLRKQVELNKEMHRRLGQDIAVQTSTVKACHKDIKMSRQPGGLRPREMGHGSDMPGGHGEYSSQLQTLTNLGNDLGTVGLEIATLEKNERQAQAKALPDAGVNNIAAWFSRYGEPKRQSHPEETARSCLMKPRRSPYANGGHSNAITLRRGWLTM